MVKYWVLSVRGLALFGLLPISLGALFILAAWNWHADRSAFVDNLRAANGRVLAFDSSDGKLFVDIEYSDEQGVLHRKRMEAPRSQESHMRESGRAGVVYDSRFPESAEIGDVTRASLHVIGGRVAIGSGALVIFAGIYLAVSRMLKVLRIRNLFRSGTIVDSEVREHALAPGNPKIGRFTYAFRGANGRWYEGRSPDLPAHILSRWHIGRPVRAAYHPADPRRNEPDIFDVLRAMERVS